MTSTSLRVILQTIYDEQGDLTAPLVVDAAANPTHPLHHRLEWDDAKGGHANRLNQAAALIRSVRIVYAEDNQGRPKDLRAFTAIRGENTPKASYTPTRQALEDPFTRQLVLRDMQREWRSFKRRYEHMAEFADLIIRDLAGETA